MIHEKFKTVHHAQIRLVEKATSLSGFPLTPKQTILHHQEMSKTFKLFRLIAIINGYIQNSRSGCKYTSSFWTLMETLFTLPSAESSLVSRIGQL